MGQKQKVIIDLLFLKGGVESYIMSTVMKKQNNTNILLDVSSSLTII